MERMDIYKCERMAKDANAHDSATFDLCGPGGKQPARWLDAYFGMVMVGDSKGFVMARDIDKAGLWCENFNANKDAE